MTGVLLVLGVLAAAVVGGVTRHLLVAAGRRGLDVANLLGCGLAGLIVGIGIDGSARTLLLMAGCGSLTSLSGIVVDRDVGAGTAAARVVAGVVVVVAVAAVTQRLA
jgi:hypothetical protein